MNKTAESNTLVMKDWQIATLFGLLSLGFILLMSTDSVFFEWAFSRHHNILSWYIRPIFIIPICFFAYKRSATGVSVSIFMVLISMFWFEMPDVVDPKVAEFLKMERDYLTGDWTGAKILVTSMVPLSIGLLVFGLWKRNIKIGIGTIIGIAVAKTLWSVLEGGASGAKVIVPAIVGLGICLTAIILWYKKRSQ